MIEEEKQTPVPSNQINTLFAKGHERHCFIVMPYGRTPSEVRWFKGWYEVVVKPAVIAAEYEPKLSAVEEHPSAINDEIQAHLAFDPMVVVDLGGTTAEDDPNPNVMYELGIRHALSLPLVMMAWKGQRLPFDVGNQRVIMEGREYLDIEPNRTKLINFIRAAASGIFYRPMEAVGRAATLDIASASLGEDSLLGALVREVKDLRDTITSRRTRRTSAPVMTVKRLIRAKTFRKDLFPLFTASGGTNKQWSQLLKTQLPPEQFEASLEWTEDQWKEFIAEEAARWATMSPKGQSSNDEQQTGDDSNKEVIVEPGEPVAVDSNNNVTA